MFLRPQWITNLPRHLPLCRSDCADVYLLACHLFLQKCPFEAIMIINLPKDLEKETTHRYGPNTFKLHRWGVCGRGSILIGTSMSSGAAATAPASGQWKGWLARTGAGGAVFGWLTGPSAFKLHSDQLS